MFSIDNSHYVVDKIIGIAIDKENSKKYYKIQWAPAWEAEDKLIGCEELIKQFLEAQANEINAGLHPQHGHADVKQEGLSSDETNQIVPDEHNLHADANLVAESREASQSASSRSNINNNGLSWFHTMGTGGSADTNTSIPRETKMAVIKCEVTSEQVKVPCVGTSCNTEETPTPLSPKKKVKTYSQTNLKYVLQKNRGKSKEVIFIEEGLFKCNECGRKLDTISKLRSHISGHKGAHKRKTNTRIQGKSCVACEKIFKSSPLLQKHIKTHTGSLECNVCCKKFKRYHSLNLHVMNVHETETEEEDELLCQEQLDDVEEDFG